MPLDLALRLPSALRPPAARWLLAGGLVGFALSLGIGARVLGEAAPVFASGNARGQLGALAVSGAGDRSKEYRVKAALVFNLVKYTTWPEGAFEKPSDPIVILVVGKDPFGAALDAAFDGKQLHGRAVQLKRTAAVPEALTAHVVFAGELPAPDTLALIALSKDKPCMLVGESAGFADKGGFVNFYEDKGKVRFEINVERKTDTKLELSAELLKLARIVKPTEKGPKK